LRGANLQCVDLRCADLCGANLRGANLQCVDLRGVNLRAANLRSVDLQCADLQCADLCDANLRSVDLQCADLCGANLQCAETDKRYISTSCIGSRKGMTTYCFDDDIIWCGCFKGTLAEFETRVVETHKDDSQYLKEYMGFINYLKYLKTENNTGEK
jgi:hypothetical protein